MIKSALRRFDDAEDFQKFIRGGDARVFVLSGGKYQGELIRIDLPHIWMQRFRQSLPTLSHIKVDESRSANVFLSDAQQDSFTYSGAKISSSEMASAALGDEHYVRFPAGSPISACSMTAADLAFFGHTLTGRELQAPSVNRVVRPNVQHMSRLRSVHGAAISLAASTPDILAAPEVGKAVEQALIQAVIACLIDQDYMVKARVSAASSRVMRHLEELLEARRDEPLYIPEICATIGVGERTLRAYCHEHLGMSPHYYFWLRRMNLVQRALVRADAGTTTVTDIATQYGFGELGRFSVSYRTLFGESPSVTLNRQPRELPADGSDFVRINSVFA